MSNGHSLFRVFATIGLALTLGGTMSACSSSSMTWKEEVQLHDGRKIIVTRSHTYGRHGEIGQGRLISGRSILFKIPGTDESVEWSSDGSLSLLLLDFKDGVPYIAGKPNTCPSFNSWGRPNPPYVFFKYADKKWHRIPFQEFPDRLNTNIVVSTKSDEKTILQEMRSRGYVTVEVQRKLNNDLDDYIRNIVRTPITSGPGTYGGCEKY